VPFSTACLGWSGGLACVSSSGRSLIWAGNDRVDSAVREAAVRRQGAGAVLVGADLVQAAADEGPAGAPDGERDFADGDDVADGQFPGRPGRVAEPQRGDWPLHSCGVSCHDLHVRSCWARYVTTDGRSAPSQLSSRRRRVTRSLMRA
jgi:hypothetical protein